MQILSYYREKCISHIATLWWGKMWILIETESDIEIFQMYGIDGTGPAPSLYTKYYRAW